MDYTPALQPLFDSLWYLIPLFIIAAAIKSPWFKRKAGEGVVNLSARLSLDKTRYHLIKNVTLSTKNGATQIDHIIVSLYGVFVGDSTFKTPMPENVTQGGGYVRFIKAQTEQRLSDVEVQKVIEAIESGRLAATFTNHREHVADVKEIAAKKSSEPRCPKCPGMVGAWLLQ